MGDNKIKYYSFNIEYNDNLLNEGLDNETKADYQSSEYNSIKYNNNILDFGNNYYDSISSLKAKYSDMLNEFVNIEYTETEQIANNIYNEMIANTGSDTNERSAILDYIDYGNYNKNIINNFIGKINNELISDIDVHLPNIE